MILLQKRLDTLADLDTVWPRDYSQNLFDVFEPSYLETSLTKPNNLGHLIFGEAAWINLGGKVWHENPLDKYFKLHGPYLIFLFILYIYICYQTFRPVLPPI